MVVCMHGSGEHGSIEVGGQKQAAETMMVTGCGWKEQEPLEKAEDEVNQ